MSAKKTSLTVASILVLTTWAVFEFKSAAPDIGQETTVETGFALNADRALSPVEVVTADTGRTVVEGPGPLTHSTGVVAAPTTSLRLLLTRAATSEAAAGVPVLWREGGLSWLRVRNRESVSNDEGAIEWKSLEPGRFSFMLPTLQEEDLDLAEGEHREIQLILAQGATVRGTVTGASGAPLANAEMILEGRVDFPAGHTNANGCYELLDVPTGHGLYLSVRADGFGSSARRSVSSVSGSEVIVDFVLGSRGAALSGTVEDLAGEPVPGAIVLVGGVEGREAVTMADGAHALAGAPRGRISDTAGRFSVAGVSPGEVEVRVRASEFAATSQVVMISPGVDARVVVQLERAARLVGRVTGPDGLPVEGVELLCNGLRYLGSRGMTDADGRYAIGGLPIGEFTLYSKPAGFRPLRMTLVGVSGRTDELDLVLSRGAAILGRVESEGLALDGLHVSAWGRRPGAKQLDGPDAVTTDPEGRFLIEGLDELGVYSLKVSVPESGVDVGVVTGIRPSGTEVVIEIDAGRVATPSVYLTGRIIDSAGHPVPQATYGVGGPGAIGTIYSCDSGDGRFRVGPYSPGEFNLFVSARGLADQRLPTPALVANERWDYGDIVLTPGGRVEVRFTRDPGAPPGDPTIQMWRGFQGVNFAFDGDTATSVPAVPGDYGLLIRGSAEAPLRQTRHTVSVREGEITVLRVALHRAEPR